MSAMEIYRPGDRVWASVKGQPPTIETLFMIRNGQAFVSGPMLESVDGDFRGTFMQATILGKAAAS